MQWFFDVKKATAYLLLPFYGGFNLYEASD